MMRFWWVNHNQTARQELDGGYLWAPMREANGARSQFYENLRLASPGDKVLSFSKGVIGHIGTVQDFARGSLKPSAFGTKGENWARQGWILPVQWGRLSTKIKPRDLILKIHPLLPPKYSPIHPKSGKGNQKAYLAEIGQALFAQLTGTIGVDQNPVALAVGSSALKLIDESLEEQVAHDPDLDSTTKVQVVLSRRGQGVYRSRIFGFETGCRLTGLQNPSFLIASHIKPWRLCTTSSERLDGANGLLLAPHVDYLFDRGLISFTDNGQVLVSPRLEQEDLKRLGLETACARVTPPFRPAQAAYLAFHRSSIFLAV